jgi:hypothetical protein
LENVAEAKAHGTWIHGETVPQSVLKEAQVAEIRALKGKIPQSIVAKRYGITQGQVSKIQSGKRWGWMKDGAEFCGLS